jgi:DNA-binding GntR family transcriptional regulator
MKFDRYCRMAYQISKDELPVNNHEHKKIAHAVLKRDKKTAEDLMTYHINGPIEDVIKNFKKNSLI